MKRKILSNLLCVILACSISGCSQVKKVQGSTTTHTNIKPVTIENVENKYYKITIEYTSGISHKKMGQYL